MINISDHKPFQPRWCPRGPYGPPYSRADFKMNFTPHVKCSKKTTNQPGGQKLIFGKDACMHTKLVETSLLLM